MCMDMMGGLELMLAITALACLAIGLFIGFNIASRVSDTSGSSSEVPSVIKAVPVKVVEPEPIQQEPNGEYALQQDPAFEDMKVVLVGLLYTLDTAIAHLQKGSEQYAAQLNLHRDALKETLTLQDLQRLAAELVNQVETMDAANTQYREQLDEANALVQQQQQDLETLQVRTGTDFLTNLRNRSAYDDRLKEMMNIARRYGNVFSLLVIDIDHFKVVNDKLGHTAGDTVLKAVSKLLSDNSRVSDFLARYGGEEFVYLLPETNTEQAVVIAEKIRKVIEKATFRYEDETIPVTISGGVGTVIPGKETGEDLFARADAALYTAKEKGRNRIETADS